MIPLSELNWTFLEIIYLIIIFIVTFLFTYFLLPYIIKFMKTKNYIGYDIHKNARPEIAESGGLSMIIGFIVASLLLIIAVVVYISSPPAFSWSGQTRKAHPWLLPMM